MKKTISRRDFIKRAAAASVAMPLIVPRLSFAQPPSGKLQYAAVGVAAQGGYDLGQIFSSGKVDVVALCDIDALNLERASKTYPGARLYRDWREMLAKEEKNIDAVSVGIPDHMHAPVTMSAIQLGKHVYCEKPLTHDVYEARQVTLAAREKGVATQMGNQIHSHEFYRTAVHWMKEGAIGKVVEWYSWCGTIFPTADKKRPKGSDPIPPNVDWDLWLGTAPKRPFLAEWETWSVAAPAKVKQPIYHPFWWRGVRDFGGGATADFGCHIFDTVFTALNIGAPLSVTAEVESNVKEFWPEWTISKYVFPGVPMSAGKTINATWLDGGKKPAASVSKHLPADFEVPPSGSIVIGEEGTLVIPHVGMPQLFPLEKFANYPKPELQPINHYHEFVEAALGNGKAGSHFDFAGPMTEAVLLS
ncbi:MAG TPA: Gfo/Idh/MocA family oxidoreductase, partial [Candidatus Hydrogenedentes bacterium]|nr:Gfo/Idh/MocA family oxidoreductase [Candidatus Hydrogenedentota bacterium]